MTGLSELRFHVRDRGDDGQLMLLVLVYTVIAGLLVTVVVNLSNAFLYRRSLVAAADGAALSAANRPDLDRIYAGAGQFLPLSEAGARSAVRQYVLDAELHSRFHGFRVVDVRTDGSTVAVTLAATVRMPFVNVLSERYRGGYPVEATVRARSPLVP
ncbi:MAG: hypothetical protein H0U35_09735 [Sporichthyaceae bacterium]|nr:hypothetical protein [Sporichthyaceae bacterium]